MLPNLATLAASPQPLQLQLHDDDDECTDRPYHTLPEKYKRRFDKYMKSQRAMNSDLYASPPEERYFFLHSGRMRQDDRYYAREAFNASQRDEALTIQIPGPFEKGVDYVNVVPTAAAPPTTANPTGVAAHFLVSPGSGMKDPKREPYWFYRVYDDKDSVPKAPEAGSPDAWPFRADYASKTVLSLDTRNAIRKNIKQIHGYILWQASHPTLGMRVVGDPARVERRQIDNYVELVGQLRMKS